MDPITLMIVGGGSAIIAFYMAWSIGANDVANSMATAVGAKAITFKQAVLIAGVLNFLGAVLLGPTVASTIKSGIIKGGAIANPYVLMLGFVASLLAAALWVTLSTWKEMPISTTHSVIGALIGFGILAGGWNAVEWSVVGKVVSSWVISPFAGCVIAFIVFRIIARLIFDTDNPVRSTKLVGPAIMGFTATLISSSLLLKTKLSEILAITDSIQALLISIIIGLIIWIIAAIMLKNMKVKTDDEYLQVESLFRKLQVITSCYVAFSAGANDVANAIAPVAAILPLAEGELALSATIPTELLFLGGVGIAAGCLTWGRKVMKTVGGRITSLTNTRGFSVDFGAATTVLIASKMGLPISTSHTVVGAVIGVGLARGLEAVDLSVIKNIIKSWLLTVPVAAATSAVIFIILRFIVGV